MGELDFPRSLEATDDRDGFDCGREALNTWFRRNAWRNHQSGVTRTTILPIKGSSRIAGYVSLSATEIRREFLPKSQQRNQPDPIPAILLGQLAVDVEFQNRGCARSLLIYALRTSLEASKTIGCFCVLTQPLDEGVRAFYESFGFETLDKDPKRTMAIRIKQIQITQ